MSMNKDEHNNERTSTMNVQHMIYKKNRIMETNHMIQYYNKHTQQPNNDIEHMATTSKTLRRTNNPYNYNKNESRVIKN